MFVRTLFALLAAPTLALGCDSDSSSTPDSTPMSDTSTSDTTDPADTTTTTDTDFADTAPDTTAPDTTTTPRDFTRPGPHRVGFRQSSVTFAPADGSAARTLRLAAWYPTAATTGTAVTYQGLLPAANILGDAPPADLGPRPVLIFSHGNTSFAEQSFFLTEFFASHGYLVVAMDHTGNTFGASFSVELLHRRPDDVRGVLDFLDTLRVAPDEAEPFQPLGALVSDKVVVAGHSFGGYTTLAVGGATWDVDLLKAYCTSRDLPFDGCTALSTWEDLYRDGFLDERVDALIPLTPGAVALFGLDGPNDVALPTLLMTGARDTTTPNNTDGDIAWDGLSKNPDNRRIDFANAGHFTFSNACTLVDLGFPISFDDGCGPTFLSPARAFAAINAYAFAFAERHLMGATDTDALLSGELVIEDDATLSYGSR